MKDETYEMLTWTFNLGQHQSELREIGKRLAYYIDRGTETAFTLGDTSKSAPGNPSYKSERYLVTKEDLEGIYHRLEFISTNMVP